MSYKEIVTKAVIGKVKKTSSNDFEMKTDEVPNTVLGCWVINHAFSGLKSPDGVDVNGSFDVNVWYSFDNDSKTGVTTKRFNYKDEMNVPSKYLDKINNNSEIIVRCLKQPTVNNVSVKDGNVLLSINKELGVEIVGDTKVKINVEEDEDDYEELIDNDVVDELDEDFLDKEV